MRSHSSPLLHADKASTGMLCPILGITFQERCGKIEKILRKAIKTIKGLEGRLKKCGLSLEKTERGRDNGVQVLKNPWKEGRGKCFFLTSEDRTRRSGLKSQHGKFRLDIRTQFLTARVVKTWTKLPREVVESPSLEVFKSS